MSPQDHRTIASVCTTLPLHAPSFIGCSSRWCGHRRMVFSPSRCRTLAVSCWEKAPAFSQSAPLPCYAASSQVQRVAVASGPQPYPNFYPPALLGYATLDRIGACTIGDAPRGIGWETSAQPRLEPLDITSSHRRDGRADARPHPARRPEVIEVGERPLHSDLPRLDRLETRLRPHVPHGV